MDPGSSGREVGLSQSQETLHLLVEGVKDYAIFMLDAEGHVLTWNSGAERIKGYAAQEIIGRHFSAFYTAEAVNAGHPAHELETARRTGRYEEEGLRVRKDGSQFWANVLITALRDDGGTLRGFAKVTRDITEKKRLEEELRGKMEQLARADRQKDEFLAMLSHELRNPLAPLRSGLYLLKTSHSDAAAFQKVHGMMERQLQQLVRLVDDLLDLSRIIRDHVELRRERLDLAEAIRQARETAAPVVDARGHVLELTLPQHPLYVSGDLVRLSQAIANLLANAAKYSDRPGRIGVQLAQEALEAIIVVKDHGVGIPPEILPHVFDLFVQGEHTLARSQGGLGIGLTLVRRVIEMHGGRVSASSDGIGKGSEFTIRLPVLADDKFQPATGAASAAPYATSEPRRVLIVDDNPDAAYSIAKVLRLSGHEVTCVHDGPSALSLADVFWPHVIFLDLGIPGMDGYEIAKRLRLNALFKQTPLFAVTASGQEQDRARSRQAGFDQHLIKPVDPEVLRRLVSP